jgi:simple sugar transport system substrate-binding protein
MSAAARLLLLAAALAAAFLAVACDVGAEESSGEDTSVAVPATTAEERAEPAKRGVRIVVVTHGQASDPFWTIVKNGIDEAARDLGAEVAYRAPDVYEPTRMRALIEAAVTEQPDGLVVSLPDATQLAPALGLARSAEIPVVAINSGADAFESVGAILYVGQPEDAAAFRAGRRMGAAGVRSAVCLNHQPGVASLMERCQGFARGLATEGGRSSVLQISSQRQRAAEDRIAATIGQGDVDGVLALGPAGATPALAAFRRERAFGRVRLATFDLAPDILRAVEAGEIDFAIDQQPFLQGYLPIALLTQRALYGLFPAEGTTIPTGPSFVTRANAGRVIALTAQGIR